MAVARSALHRNGGPLRASSAGASNRASSAGPSSVEIPTVLISQLGANFIIYIQALWKHLYLAGAAIFFTFLSFATWILAPVQPELDGWFILSGCATVACFFVLTFLVWNEEHSAREEASGLAIKGNWKIDEVGDSRLSGRINGAQFDRSQEDSDWKYLYLLLTISNTGAPTAIKSWKVTYHLPTGTEHTVADEELSRQPVGLDGAAGNLVLRHSVIPTGGRCSGWLLLRCSKKVLDGLSGAGESDFRIEFWDVDNHHHVIQ
jgi:hypothetical protein